MTPTNPTDDFDFDFDDLPDLPLLEDDGGSVPHNLQEPDAVAQAKDDEGMGLPGPVDLDLPEVSATPSIESAQPESDEAVPVAEAEPDVEPEIVPAESTPSIEPEREEGSQPVPEQSMEPEISEEEQHADAVLEDVVPPVPPVSLATEEETLSEIAEFEPASQAEQPPSDEPAVEVPFVEEDPNPGQPDAAFVHDPEQAPSPPHSVLRSRKPLIIGGAVAAVLAIGAAAFLFWPGSEHRAPVQASASAPSSPAADPSTPAPTVEPERELTTAGMVSDVLTDQPQVEPTLESVVQPSAPEGPVPEVQVTTPAPVAVKSEPAPTPTPTLADKPAAAAAKPSSAPAPAKPAKKPAPQKTEEQGTKWQDEALNALDAFEKGL